MFIALDMQSVRVVHAHTAQRVCSALADIEMPHVPVRIMEVNYPADLESLTDWELNALYRNSTGQKAPGFFRDHALRGCTAAILAMPETDARLEEVLAQAAAVSGSTERFRYLRGARRPAPVTELFELPTLQSAVTDHKALLDLAPASPSPQAVPAVVPVPAAAPSPAKAPPRAAKPASAPGAGTVAERIYNVCEELRLALTGHTLEQVRAAAIAALVARGVNENSARKGSGLWIVSRRETACSNVLG